MKKKHWYPKHQYEIYQSDCSNPVWTYKTSHNFYKRLRRLAETTPLTKVWVRVVDLGQWYVVALNPSKDVTWSTVQVHEDRWMKWERGRLVHR